MRVGALLFCACAAVAAVVSLDETSDSDGYLVVPVLIQAVSEDSVAGLQFDVTFDSARWDLVDVELGTSAYEAGKDVFFSDLSSGSARVVVAGFNQETLADGAVAQLVLCPLEDCDAATGLALDSLVASDPLGRRVEAGFLSGANAADEDSDSPEKRLDDDVSTTEAVADAADADGAATTAGARSSGVYSVPEELSDNESDADGVPYSPSTAVNGSRPSGRNVSMQPAPASEASTGQEYVSSSRRTRTEDGHAQRRSIAESGSKGSPGPLLGDGVGEARMLAMASPSGVLARDGVISGGSGQAAVRTESTRPFHRPLAAHVLAALAGAALLALILFIRGMALRFPETKTL